MAGAKKTYRYSVKLERDERLPNPGAWFGYFLVTSLDDNSSHHLIATFAWEYVQATQNLRKSSVLVEINEAPSELTEQSSQKAVRVAVTRLRETVE